MWSFIKVLFWGIAMLFTWPLVELFRRVFKKPRVDNCFTWACRRWQENPDSYLVIRWCKSSRTSFVWPHFLWLDKQYNQNMKHFLPLIDQQETKLFPDPFFNGKVVTGDDEELEN